MLFRSPGFVNVPYNDVQAINDAYVEGKTCAVLLEPVQGEGGVNIPSENYLKEVMDFCHDKNILFMLDEVQTGIARTGEWFGFQHEPVVPDVISLAKGLGNGVPIGACLARGKAAEVLTAMTGDAFFPGGMSGFEIEANEFLVFEEGPSVSMTLQWATYRDASDQCSLSRIWGGIHPPADDIPGRLAGIEVGVDAFRRAVSYFDGSVDNP